MFLKIKLIKFYFFNIDTIDDDGVLSLMILKYT